MFPPCEQHFLEAHRLCGRSAPDQTPPSLLSLSGRPSSLPGLRTPRAAKQPLCSELDSRSFPKPHAGVLTQTTKQGGQFHLRVSTCGVMPYVMLGFKGCRGGDDCTVLNTLEEPSGRLRSGLTTSLGLKQLTSSSTGTDSSSLNIR